MYVASSFASRLQLLPIFDEFKCENINIFRCRLFKLFLAYSILDGKLACSLSLGGQHGLTSLVFRN